MVRPKEGNFKSTTLNLDPTETDKFMKSLPNNKSLSEVVREFIRDENDRKAREKKAIGLDNSPIKSSHLSRSDKQSALDKYFGDGFMDYKNWQLRQEIFNKMTERQKQETSIALNNQQKAWHSLVITEQSRRKNRHERS